MQKKRIVFVLVPAVLAIFLATGCTANLYSYWKDREIIIDGKNDEWQDVKTYFRDKNVALGAFNDNDYLYLHVVSWDKDMARMLVMSGFTVWFDSSGGHKKKFGIHFPMGIGDSPMAFMDGGDHRPGWRSSKGGPGKPAMVDEDLLREIEIVNFNKDESTRNSIEFFKERGIEVKIGEYSENMVYELKVPFAKNAQHPYALGNIADNGRIGVCFEIPKPQAFGSGKIPKGKMPGGGMPGGGMPGGGMPGGGMPGGDMPGGGPGGGGMPGGGMPGGRHGGEHGGGPGGFGEQPKIPDGLELWVNIELSAKD